MVGSPDIRFYAGAPLVTSDGFALGALCVIDRAPRQITPEQQAVLEMLARQVAGRIEMSRQIALQNELIARQAVTEQHLRLALESGGLGSYLLDITTAQFLVLSETCRAHFALSPEAQVTRTEFLGMLHPDDRDIAQQAFLSAVQGRRDYSAEYVYHVSAKANVGINSLRDALTGKISAFAGTSGVGKSSLLNVLSPGLTLKTGDISNAQRSGRHTTTTAELVPFAGDGETWVADTPGLRQVDFYEIDRDQMQYCFPEFAPFLPECRFADCMHHTELGCAVRAAVDSGTIDPRRYQSFLQMTDNADASY